MELAMTPDEMKSRTKQLSLRVMRLVRALEKTVVGNVIGKQVLRSGTSVGANYRAACRARSDREFLAKLSIVIEEADETAYWLELIMDDEMIPEKQVKPLHNECEEIIAMMVSSRKTAQARTKNGKQKKQSKI